MIEYNPYNRQLLETDDAFEEKTYKDETILSIDGLWWDEIKSKNYETVDIKTNGQKITFYVNNLPKYKNQTFPGEQYAGIRIVTSNHVIIAYISPYQHCCEVFGSILSQDDLTQFIGTKLRNLYLTNTACETQYVDYIISQESPSSDYYRIQFINFGTDKGVLQFTVYNADNGYYGHDVVIWIDSVIEYKNKLGGEYSIL